MAFNNAPVFRAGGPIAPMRFVAIDATADHQVVQAGVGGKPIGISQVGMKRTPGLAGSDTNIAAEAGDPIQVYTLGDDVPLTCGAAVVRGNMLKPDADGKGIPTAVAADNAGAVALESTSGTGVDVVIRVQILSRTAG
jgi:hypothetical protein